MFSGWDTNIQARPTPTLYEVKASGEILIFASINETFSLISAELREVVISLGDFSSGNVSNSFSLVSVIKGVPIVSVPSVSGNISASYSLTSAELKAVIVSLTTISLATSASYSLTSAELKAVIKLAGNYEGKFGMSFGLTSVEKF